MADLEPSAPVLPMVVSANGLSRHHGDNGWQEGFRDVLNGQRFTDARVADGVEGISRQINQDAMYLDAEANRNAQFAARNISDVRTDLAGGFLGNSQGQAATDRNVDHGFRHLASEVNGSDRHLDDGIDDVDRDVLRGFRETERGQRVTDDRVNDNARWLRSGQEADTRFLRSGQEADTRYLDRNVDGTRRDTERGFAHTNEHLADAERRIERDVDAGRREGEAGRERLDTHLSHTERRVTDHVDHTERRLHTRADDAERRTDNRIDASERRIEGVTRHGFEETAGALADHDRRVETRLERLACEVGHEGERTRGLMEKSELETRLYLRDREDRTHDLIRILADRNLDEMRGFERRTFENEVKTRDLIRHEAEEADERRFARGLARETRLENKIDLLEELGRRHRYHGRGEGDISINIADTQGQSQRQRQRAEIDPNLTV